MKKSVVFILMLSIAQFAGAWSKSELKAMQELVDAGQPKLQFKSRYCQNHKIGGDLLVHAPSKRRHGECVKTAKLPKKVRQEILQMVDEQLENESDYDGRITKVYVMEHEGIRLSPKSGVSKRQLEKIRQALRIPDTGNARFQSMLSQPGHTFKMINYYLMIGGHGYELENTYVGQFLKKHLDGQSGLQITFDQELGLYPGGGMNVTYHVFMMENKLVYVKGVWWNA